MASRRRNAPADPAAPLPVPQGYVHESIYFAALQSATRRDELEVKQTEIQMTGLAHHTSTLGSTLNGTIGSQAHHIDGLMARNLDLLAQVAQRDKRIADLERQSEEF